MIGSGYTGNCEAKKGPPGLDGIVCDIKIVEVEGERTRIELTIRQEKNDQTREEEVTVVYADEQSDMVCPVAKLRQWMVSARLRKGKGCIKGRPGCKECGRKRCMCDCSMWEAVQECCCSLSGS